MECVGAQTLRKDAWYSPMEFSTLVFVASNTVLSPGIVWMSYKNHWENSLVFNTVPSERLSLLTVSTSNEMYSRQESKANREPYVCWHGSAEMNHSVNVIMNRLVDTSKITRRREHLNFKTTPSELLIDESSLNGIYIAWKASILIALWPRQDRE